MQASSLVVWLDDPAAAGNPALGGKFGSLGRSVADGLPVPVGFGITTHAYRAFLAANGLVEEAARVRRVAAELPPERIAEETRALHAALATAPLPPDLTEAVAEAYATLERRAGAAAVPVAVRSSGESEDLAGASFAGQYETYLWITGIEAVLANMRRCWAGLFGTAVLSYRPEGQALATAGDLALCVGVQRMVEARAAGVTFTLDPLNGDRSKVVTEACWGLGEGVVKGDITPSRFVVDKVTRNMLRQEIRPQAEEYRFDRATGGVGLFTVEAERQATPCLGAEEVQAVVALGRDIEARRGAPMDIEWAMDRDGRLWVLQVRPETVWSRKPPEPIKVAGTPIAHVLSRLSGAGMFARKG